MTDKIMSSPLPPQKVEAGTDYKHLVFELIPYFWGEGVKVSLVYKNIFIQDYLRVFHLKTCHFGEMCIPKYAKFVVLSEEQ